MGKAAKKNKKSGSAAPPKVPLDEQITQGRVHKPKEKFKLRFRAEEENVKSNYLCDIFDNN